MFGQAKDLTGGVYGKLTVLERAGSDKHRNAVWKCLCECGNIYYINGRSLTTGHTKSCGCSTGQFISNAKMTTKEISAKYSRLYNIWGHMRQRCNNPNDKRYERYGGRGITICAEWNDFESFLLWALANGYEDNLEIDRIDNNGNYEPDNCRWTTDLVQARNREVCIYQEIDGKTMTLSEIADLYHIKRATLYHRYHVQNLRNDELINKTLGRWK